MPCAVAGEPSHGGRWYEASIGPGQFFAVFFGRTGDAAAGHDRTGNCAVRAQPAAVGLPSAGPPQALALIGRAAKFWIPLVRGSSGRKSVPARLLGRGAPGGPAAAHHANASRLGAGARCGMGRDGRACPGVREGAALFASLTGGGGSKRAHVRAPHLIYGCGKWASARGRAGCCEPPERTANRRGQARGK